MRFKGPPPAPRPQDVYPDRETIRPDRRNSLTQPGAGLVGPTRGALAQTVLRNAAPPASRRPVLLEEASTVTDDLRVISITPVDFDRLTDSDFDPQKPANREWMNALGIFSNQGNVTLRVDGKTHKMDTSNDDFGTLLMGR